MSNRRKVLYYIAHWVSDWCIALNVVNSEANMLFLESPVGVGFAFLSNSTYDYVNVRGDENHLDHCICSFKLCIFVSVVLLSGYLILTEGLDAIRPSLFAFAVSLLLPIFSNFFLLFHHRTCFDNMSPLFAVETFVSPKGFRFTKGGLPFARFFCREQLWYSYAIASPKDQNMCSDITADDSYAFLQNWFMKFPSYNNRTFYIAGESYAGKYVPELAALIHEKNSDEPTQFINLKGILLGNPETSDAEDWQGMIDYAWSHAVISDQTYKTVRESCDFNSNDTWSNDHCSDAVDEVLKNYNKIDMYSLYTSVCLGDLANAEKKSKQVVFKKSTSKMMPRIMGGYDLCRDDYVKSYYNTPDVQKALHVSNGRQLKNWTLCNMDVFEGWVQSIESVLPIYKILIDLKLRIWVYSGDTDGRVPLLSTRGLFISLGVLNKVAGWLQEYDGLSYATFKGAGHQVPVFKPSESLAFFRSFLLGQSPTFEP
ncbi:serine carboxypeptidase-like protein 31 [Tanacetum coccineum]